MSHSDFDPRMDQTILKQIKKSKMQKSKFDSLSKECSSINVNFEDNHDSIVQLLSESFDYVIIKREDVQTETNFINETIQFITENTNALYNLVSETIL